MSPRTPTASARTGYSGKPLWQKLGLRRGLRVRLLDAPQQYWALCEFDPAQVTLLGARAPGFDFGHAFVTTRATLAERLPRLAANLDATGMLWISWPKKGSGVSSDMTEECIRELALPLGLVDVKVCAVDATWSGLKLMWRRSHRPDQK